MKCSKGDVDREFMKMALSEAVGASGRGEVPIGAIVVGENGRVLARAGNSPVGENDPAGHAEILALREAGKTVGNYRLTGCTVYVTLEPCPMCAGAMVHARIRRLVYGATDSKGGGIVSCYRIGTDGRLNHAFEVVGGLMADESSGLLRKFFRARRKSSEAPSEK